MRTLARWLLTAAVVAMVGGSALAQRPMQPGGGGTGGTGGGGFGAALALGTGLKARLSDNKDLQEEVKLTDDQKDKIKKFVDKVTEANKPATGGGTGGGGGGFGGGGGGFGGFGGGGGGTDEEQIERLKKQIAAIEERQKFFKDTLTAEQVKRIAQLETQMLGMRAFSNEKVAKDLKITDEQKESIKKINEEYTKESADLRKEYGMGGGFGGGGGGGGGGGTRPDPEKTAEYTKKAKVLREEATEKIEKALTADQKKTWTDMIGTPFDTSKLQQNFGGFGGGGGTRPGGGTGGARPGGTPPAAPGGGGN